MGKLSADDLRKHLEAAIPQPIDQSELVRRAVRLAGRRNAVICDLDGTLCIFNGRGPFEMERCGDDLISLPVDITLQAFAELKYALVLVTGRFEQYRPQTETWLARHGIAYDALFMRSDGDYRKDADVKRELYAAKIEPQYNVLLALDDRNQSVACWRELGVPCFQVAPGDF